MKWLLAIPTRPSCHTSSSLRRPSSNQVSPRASADLFVENNFWLPFPAVKMVACEHKQFLSEDLSSSSRKARNTSQHLGHQWQAEIKGHPSSISHPKSFIQLLNQSALSEKLWRSIIFITIPEIMSPSFSTKLPQMVPGATRLSLQPVDKKVNAKPSWEILPRKIQHFRLLVNELVDANQSDILQCILAVSLWQDYAIWEQRKNSIASGLAFVFDPQWLIDFKERIMLVGLKMYTKNVAQTWNFQEWNLIATKSVNQTSKEKLTTEEQVQVQPFHILLFVLKHI